MARDWPIPNLDTSLLCIGDLHHGGSNSTTGNLVSRLAKAQADLTGGNIAGLPMVQVGDLVEEPLSANDTPAIAWMNALGSAFKGAILGNHDIGGAGIGNTRTAADAIAALGLQALNYTVDLGFVKAIMLGGCSTAGQMDQATLDFLAAQLVGSKPCWVVCHYPLYNTVVGDIASVYSSVEDNMHVTGPNRADATDDSEIRAVLNAHSTAKAWICGHTHSPLDAPGFIKAENVGSRNVASINCSALIYTGRSKEIYDPLLVPCLTLEDDGSITVRFRDCGAGVWRPDLKTSVTPS